MKNVGIIILAAGASTRLGKPKQLVKFRGKTLLENAIQNSLNTNCESTVTVLGANSDKIKHTIPDFPVEFVINRNWQSGMSSSIKCGLEHLLNSNSQIGKTIIILCDQPLIGSKQINSLFEKSQQSCKPIIATQYETSIGVPALFSKELFPKLLKLNETYGAKRILKNNFDLVETIEIPEANFDVDTLEDLQLLKNLEQK